MRITNLPSGALQANTYLAVDEKNKRRIYRGSGRLQ